MVEEIQIRKDLVEALGKSSLLQFLREHSPDSRTLREMLQTSKVQSYNEGEVILEQGDNSDSMFFIAEGRVEVSVNGKPVCTLGRMGDVFGEMGMITGERRSATVKALDPVTCLVTAKKFMTKLNKRENLLFLHLMQQALNRVMAARLTTTTEELGEAKSTLQEVQAEIEILKLVNQTQETELKELKEPVGTGSRFRGPQHAEAKAKQQRAEK